jgi:glutamyl-tRNA synthetase
VQEFKDQGFLPEAMVNYLALLGWGPRDGEEFPRPVADLVAQFSLTDVSSAPAFFDVKKLTAINAEWIRGLPVEEFVARARPFLTRGAATEAVLEPLAALVQERVRLLTEVEPMVAFLLDEPLEVDEPSWAKAMKGPAAELLDAAIAALDGADAWTATEVRAAVEAAAMSTGLVNAEGQPQLSKAQAPVRVATTGRGVGPPLFESLEALGRERTLARLREARARL